jgi:L-threonylcarbamoyladenylate synthase
MLRLLPTPADLARAAALIAAGGVVIFPTETFYGLAADPWQPAAVDRVIALKGRPDGAPILLVLPDLAAVDAVAGPVPDAARRLMARHWPGPLTLVLPARPGLAAAVTGPRGVGVRVSSHPVAAALARACGRAITATSANRSGAPPATDPAVAAADLPGADALLDGGPTAGGPPSTVAAVDPDGTILVLRPGACDVPGSA